MALHPCLTTSFILGYAQAVLVEKFTVDVSFRRLLPTLATLCRHTDLVHITYDGTDVEGCRYVWVHRNIRPWGHNLPVQCDGCGHVRSFISTDGPNGAMLFACNIPGCRKKLNFKAENSDWFGGEVHGGRWMKVEY